MYWKSVNVKVEFVVAILILRRWIFLRTTALKNTPNPYFDILGKLFNSDSKLARWIFLRTTVYRLRLLKTLRIHIFIYLESCLASDKSWRPNNLYELIRPQINDQWEFDNKLNPYFWISGKFYNIRQIQEAL